MATQCIIIIGKKTKGKFGGIKFLTLEQPQYYLEMELPRVTQCNPRVVLLSAKITFKLKAKQQVMVVALFRATLYLNIVRPFVFLLTSTWTNSFNIISVSYFIQPNENNGVK